MQEFVGLHNIKATHIKRQYERLYANHTVFFDIIYLTETDVICGFAPLYQYR